VIGLPRLGGLSHRYQWSDAGVVRLAAKIVSEVGRAVEVGDDDHTRTMAFGRIPAPFCCVVASTTVAVQYERAGRSL
jgi:hypothetical protein